MLLHIRHETVYHYAEAARYTIQVLHLSPRREARQRVVSWSIHAPGQRTEQTDAFGNVVHYVTMETPHRELRLLVSGVVETDETAGHPNGGAEALSPLAFRTATSLTQADAALLDFARGSFPVAGDSHERLLRGAEAVAAAVVYRPGTTQVSDTAISAFQRGEGVCQDQAHVFVACARALGMPARYVSGYLLGGAGDDVASHAWAEVWLADAGHWYGLDITHRRPVGGHHCRLAVGRDYLDAAPVRGMRRGGGQEQMRVAVLVTDAAQQ